MLRNKSVILSFCFIICLGLLWSQTYTVSGKVLDFKTEKPIGNVNIYIENSEIGIDAPIRVCKTPTDNNKYPDLTKVVLYLDFIST